LTGLNGSGKSQLLEAVESKQVIINNSNVLKIARFNFENFRLENENHHNAQQIYQEADQAWSFFRQQVMQQIHTWKQSIGDTYEKLIEQCKIENIPLWDCNELPEAYTQQVKDHFQIGQHPYVIAILAMIKKLPYSIDEVTEEDFKARYKPFMTKQDFLPATIGKVIWDYHIKYELNEFSQFRNEKRKANHRVFTEIEFIKQHGEKPWEIFNKILESFNTLNYRINSPEGIDTRENFILKLIHTENPNLQIDFSSLSSGERVLMALVAFIYTSKSEQHFPDVLLLDELDASLHPSMIKNMLNVIQNVFLMNNVKIILVTHSPTTIALCPEESIYVMNRAGSNRIEKKDRHGALSILTEGFATLEEGILLFDQTAPNKVNIFTEGNNTSYLRKALEIENIENEVKIIEGLESITSKSQLKTLFEFFACVAHKNKVLFVWDCDAIDIVKKLQECNQTYRFIFEKNLENKLMTTGIENLFPSYLFERFLTRVTPSKGEVRESFDENRKRDFEMRVLQTSRTEDFSNFQPFIAKVRDLSKF
jgi:predicted ATPase